MLLSKQDKMLVRCFAIDAYENTGGDFQKSKAVVSADIREHMKNRYGSIIGTILIGIAIRLAIALIKHWIKNNVLTPSEQYQLGEPGYDPNL